MSNEELYLVIGCFGRSDSGDKGDLFVSCRGAENRILKINDSLDGIEDMMNYFESVRLFDKPMFDQNAIRHVLYNMQDRYDQKFKRLWSEKYYNLLERFMISHRACGVYIKLILVNSEFDEKPEPEQSKIFIPGTPESVPTQPELRIIRGRK